MMFAAVVGHRSGRATASLRDAPQRQSMEIVGRETIYRNRNAVQTNPATSHSPRPPHQKRHVQRIELIFRARQWRPHQSRAKEYNQSLFFFPF
jgi:hypothetical protein